MHGNKKKNSLIVIENGMLVSYSLDDKLIWEVGRLSPNNTPDIILHSSTVSRRHGRFQNVDGMWFYIDNNGKNGTVYNGKYVTTGIRGRSKPITLKEKDVLIFGGGKEAVINTKTIWTLFIEKEYDGRWRVEDTKGLDTIVFSDGDNITRLNHPDKGTVIEHDDSLAIYMGSVTYLVGNIDMK